MKKAKLYYYKLTVDNGGAPCVYRNVLSLAICKPDIRSTCRVGDWIFGFGGKNLGERLIYISKITEKLSNGEYYGTPSYHSRPDNIYRWCGKYLKWKRGSRYHSHEDAERDIDLYPGYRRANVLISNDFRYFGNVATDSYKQRYSGIKAAIEQLRQGHRVNHSPELLSEFWSLRDDIWKSTSIKKLGEPNDDCAEKKCSQIEGELQSIYGGC